MALSSGSTLFEAVPALSTMARQGTGVLKLVPVNLDLPQIELSEGINRIGRDPEQAQHVINGTQISRLHCAVIIDGTNIWVRDLGSHNGTYVNRERISEGPAKPGDEISVSRMATYRLVADQEIAQVAHVDMMAMDEEEMHSSSAVVRASSTPPSLTPQPAIAQPVASQRESTSSQPMPRDVTSPQAASPLPAVDDEAPTIEQIERQRNVLAILYQISLRCLMSADVKEREQLLSNVLPRLTAMDAGFILYKVGESWRASICPGEQQPPDPLVKACFRLARRSPQPVNLDNPQLLEQIGLNQGGAMVIPLVIDDRVIGVIGAVNYHQPFSTDDFDVVTQLGNVTAAALSD